MAIRGALRTNWRRWQSFFGTLTHSRRPAVPRRTNSISFELLESRLAPAIVTPFVPARFTTNDTGDIVIAANTLETATTVGNAGRTQQDVLNAQNGVGNFLSNNDWNMVYVNVDPGAGARFNSSQAALTVPLGSTVLFAGLYWGANSASAQRNQVLFSTPSSNGYLSLTGVVLGDSTGVNPAPNPPGPNYEGFRDVTNLVRLAGSGVYTVANVQSTTGNNQYAGWSLVVAYRSPGAPPRNLTVFDGYAVIKNGDPNLNIPISGFVAPPNGPVNAKVGVIAYEGDRGITGDSLQLNGRTLSDSLNPATNFFNSTISTGNIQNTSKTPNFVNQLGFDAKIVQVPAGVIPNGATSATLTLTTTGDTYFPGAVTTAIDLFAPDVESTKTAVDLNGGDLLPGDTVEYTVSAVNVGKDPAGNVVLTDPIPANTHYVPGSLVITSGAVTGPQTDPAGDDLAEYDAANNRVVFRLGSGATATMGGTLPINASSSIRFRVTVDPGTPAGTNIPNQAAINYTGVTTGFNFNSSSTVANLVVANFKADLALFKIVSNTTPNVGDTITYTLNLTNNGPNRAGDVTVSDPLPTGLQIVGNNPSQGTYNASTGTWIVGTLANGATATLTITAIVLSSQRQTNTATVSNSDAVDPNPNNNSSTAVITPQKADLAVSKFVDNPTPNVGDTITYTVQVTNNGPDTATNVTLIDTLQPGLTFAAANPSQGAYNPVTGIWTVGTLANGATATLTITVTVTTTNSVLNTASVKTSDQFDPDPNNNSASAEQTPQQADLVVSKSVDNPTPNPGATITYFVEVFNAGPDTATNVQLTDTFPAGITVNTGVPSQGTYLNGVWNVGTLVNGASARLRITATVNAPGVQQNSVTVTRSDQFDPNLANNTAVTSLVPNSADVAIAKSVSNARPNVGDVITYTLTVFNVGPNDATAVSVTDQLPATLGFIAATPSQGAYDPTTGIWTVGTVLNGGTATLAIQARVLDPTVKTNKATVTNPAQFDPNLGNNTDNSVVRPRQADLVVVKTVDNTTPNVGDVIHFTVDLRNAGPNTATNVTIQDSLPAGLTFISAVPSQGTYNPSTGVWTVGTVTTSFARTLRITAQVTSPAPGTNTASVATSDQFDPNTNNNSSSVTQTPQLADLLVLKSADVITTMVGNTAIFTISLINLGPDRATNVVIRDVLPSGLIFVSANPSEGTYDPATGSWTLSQVDVTERPTLQITALVVSPAPQTNTVAVSRSDQFDPNLANNRASATVNTAADLFLAKTVDNSTPTLLSTVNYTFVIGNNGPSTATNVTVSDPFPAGVSFVVVASISQGSYDSATGIWNVGTLANGATATLTITAQVTVTGSITNTALTAADQFDPVLANNLSSTTLESSKDATQITKQDLLGSSTFPVPLTITSGDPFPAAAGVIGTVAIGSDAGAQPLVRVFNATTGQERFRFYAYDSSFTGGVRVAVGDVNGDGVADIITATGPGGGPHVKVFDGSTGTLLASFYAYDPSFTGGVYVAVGDVTGDGRADIVTGADAGGGPNVRVFDGATFTRLRNFFAYDNAFTGGVRVAVGDVTGDGVPDIITGAGPGGGPNVRVFDGVTGLTVRNFFAYDAAFRGGIFVAAGNVNGDRFADVITGTGAGGAPLVKVFSGLDTSMLDSFFAAAAADLSGVRVAGVTNVFGVLDDIATASGVGAAPRVRFFNSPTHTLTASFLAFNATDPLGLFIGASRHRG